MASGEGDGEQHWETYDAPSSYVAEGGVPHVPHTDLPPPAPTGHAADRAPRSVSPRRRKIGLVAVGAGGVLAVLAVLGAVGAHQGRSWDSWDARSPQAVRQAVEELQVKTGSSKVFSVQFDEHDMSLVVPKYPGAHQSVSYDYNPYDNDGDLDDNPAAAGDPWDGGPAFDLGEVDTSRFRDFCKQAEARLSDVDSCTVTAELPSPEGQRGFYLAAAVDHYQKWSEVAFDRTGHEVWHGMTK